MLELALGITAIVGGVGFAGVAIAWVNDRRETARQRRDHVDAKTILDTRFAKGEIDAEEYASKIHLLLYGPPLQIEQPDR